MKKLLIALFIIFGAFIGVMTLMGAPNIINNAINNFFITFPIP